MKKNPSTSGAMPGGVPAPSQGRNETADNRGWQPGEQLETTRSRCDAPADDSRRQLLRNAGLGGGLLALLGSTGLAAPALAAGRGTPAPAPVPTGADTDAATPVAMAPQTRQAVAELGAMLREFDAQYLQPERAATSPLDVIEGHRFLLHLLSAGVELYMEADPERPLFVRMVSATRKFLGDNPDAFYYSALLRGDRYYRITGQRKGREYISYTVHGGDHDGNWNSPAISHINHRDILFARDGSYELILGPERRGRNWLRTGPGAVQVINRHYYELQTSAAANPEVRPELHIEALEPRPGPAPLPDDAEMARRVRAVTRFIRITSLDMPAQTPDSVPRWWSVIPNQMGEPVHFGPNQGDIGAGAIDNTYMAGPYLLQPGQALLLEGALPECFFANVVLWNRFMQTDDYRYRQVSLNRTQMELQQGNRYRIVVAAQNPGVRNWLDTAGHPFGTVQWRFLLAAGGAQKPRARVVSMEEARRPF